MCLKLNDTYARSKNAPGRHVTLSARFGSVFPKMMLVEIVHSMTYWLNAFVRDDGVSVKQSPRQILTKPTDYNVVGRIRLGEYAQVTETHDASVNVQQNSRSDCELPSGRPEMTKVGTTS